jgi:hypothetical protein
MAFYDDKRWLLKHIRHSFITGDESQLCEHVLLNNDFPLPRGEYDSDDDQASDKLPQLPLLIFLERAKCTQSVEHDDKKN